MARQFYICYSVASGVTWTKTDIHMKRESVYPYTVTAPPGANIHRLRKARDLTLRELAKACKPPLTFPACSRIEKNMGYTQDSLQRIAGALRVNIADLFLPPELALLPLLPHAVRDRITETVRDAAFRHIGK